MQIPNIWYTSSVLKGDQTGRMLAIPTVNLDPRVLPTDFKQGVYATLVKYDNHMYKGALYFGPRLVLNETHNILEINIFDFNKEIYNETIAFQIKDFIRGIQNFPTLEKMREQMEKDIKKIKELLTYTHSTP